MVPAASAAPDQLHFSILTVGERQTIVEQQTDTAEGDIWPGPGPWVENHSGCWWDVDDHQTLYASEDELGAGQMVTQTDCIIAESDPIWNTNFGYSAWWSNPPRPLGVELRAPSDQLIVEACFSPQARCFSNVPVYDPARRLYVYNVCVGVVYGDPYDPAIVAIPDSGAGGIGVQTTRTVTVTNPTSRTVRKISGEIAQNGYGWDDASCPYRGGTYSWANVEFPFVFQ